MSSISGDCFVVLKPSSEENSVIFGRNSIQPEGEVQEVIYFPPSEEPQNAQCDGGATIDQSAANAVILNRCASCWGGESGANDKNVCMGIVWSDGEPSENSLKSSDIVKLILERSSTAAEAVDNLGSLISEHGCDDSKFSFIAADPTEVWLISTGGKLWAAEQITEGFRRIPSGGLAVTTKIDKSSDDLGDKLKDLGLWDGSGDLDFAKSFSSSPTSDTWPGDEPSNEGGFSLTDMFETLRNSSTDSTRSSQVSTLVSSGISCHWFTATPNPRESVFKPFAFAPNARISPLTKIPDGETVTLLHKLHDQRKWDTVGDLLKSLESTCIDEVKKFLSEHPTPNAELDELMKDCVEAEVKFYR